VPDGKDDALAVLERLTAAIAAADVPAVLAEFWGSEQVVMLGSEQGEEAYGVEQLENLWSRVLSRGQTYRWLWREPRTVVHGHVTWVTSDALVHITEGSSEREVSYRATLVLVREEERWVIAQYHGSEPATAWD
jgi:ketosteroid isomerase-like protein